MSEPTETAPPPDIVAKAGRYYRFARYIICTLAFGAGLWFGYDGFYRYPAEKARFEDASPAEQAKMEKPPNDLSILLQQRIFYILTPLAPFLLAYFLYRSRGEYRLSGTTLFVPGHPPVPFDAIVGLDKSKWKRKGILGIDYKLTDSAPPRRLTLDDFIYDQNPTDEIVEALTLWLRAEGVIEDDSTEEDGELEADAPGTRDTDTKADAPADET